MSAEAEVDNVVQQALLAGQTTVKDSATGYHRSLYANCPNDGTPVSVRRVVYGPGHKITEVIMRCPDCGQEFKPAPESLYLR